MSACPDRAFPTEGGTYMVHMYYKIFFLKENCVAFIAVEFWEICSGAR
jgi:hypothetical protein